MRIPTAPKRRLWWERATWVIPLLGILAALLVYVVVGLFDEFEYLGGAARASLSASATMTILAAIGGGMITFTGFVFSVVLLILQFGSTAYSPRSVAYFLRARSIQWILALFLATITFSFLSLIEVGSLGREDFVPATAVSVSVLLLLASLAGFVVLLHTVGRNIRVDAVLSSLGRSSRRTLAERINFLPRHATATGAGLVGRAPEPAATEAPGGQPAHVVDFGDENGQVVAIDVRALARLARRHACRIEVLVRVGDAVTPGTPVARVVGVERSLDRRVSHAVVVDAERSLVHDPLYALRLLVDVAIRALSPAVNDPTTAVRALDEIEGVLRVAAAGRLGAVQFDLNPGALVLSRPTWDELVDLALLEILQSGRGQVQVSRRMLALVEDLIPDVGVDQRAVLEEYLRDLQADAAVSPGRAGRIAGHGDRQGLGGSG
jgi:uncharacterized membrane protein